MLNPEQIVRAGGMKKILLVALMLVSLTGCGHTSSPKPTGWPKADQDAFLTDRAHAGASLKTAECQLANAEKMFPDWAHAQFATLTQLDKENEGCP